MNPEEATTSNAPHIVKEEVGAHYSVRGHVWGGQRSAFGSSRAAAAFCTLHSSIWGVFVVGHCSREMGDAGEDDVRRPCRDHQVSKAVRRCDAFPPFLSLCCRPAESGRRRRGPRDRLTPRLMVTVALLFVFCRGAAFSKGHDGVSSRRRGNHRPAEANAPQRLRCDGEAVPPPFGMLHSGVPRRSTIAPPRTTYRHLQAF